MAKEQLGDVGMHSELLKFKVEAKQITLDSGSSTLKRELYVLLSQKLSDVKCLMYYLRIYTPWCTCNVHLMWKRYFLPSQRKDCANWTKSCLLCQHSKVPRHVHGPVGNCDLPLHRFRFIHIDIVDYAFYLTFSDTYSIWADTFPMTNQTTETLAETFFSG
ncbi:hypothetical protein TNCV_2233591 [Trichonephila clavipes]|nr:hypothetical protein TNCV_2233591 [Trichonephila clavipes]